MTIGYLLAFLFLLCLTAGTFLFGYAARRAATVLVTLLEVSLGLMVITLVLLFYQQLSFQQLLAKPNAANWLYLGLAAVTGAVGGNYFSLLNLKWGGEAINSLLSPAITATVVLLSVLLESAPLSLPQAVGITITLVSVVLFLYLQQGDATAPLNRAKTFWSGIATVACISVTILFSVKGAASGISILHALWLRFLLALPVMAGLYVLQKDKRLPSDTKFYGLLLLAVALQTVVGSYLWFEASLRMGLPLFQTVIATLPFWVFAVEVFVLRKRKPSTLFLIASVVAAVGVGLTVLR